MLSRLVLCSGGVDKYSVLMPLGNAANWPKHCQDGFMRIDEEAGPLCSAFFPEGDWVYIACGFLNALGCGCHEKNDGFTNTIVHNIYIVLWQKISAGNSCIHQKAFVMLYMNHKQDECVSRQTRTSLLMLSPSGHLYGWNRTAL